MHHPGLLISIRVHAWSNVNFGLIAKPVGKYWNLKTNPFALKFHYQENKDFEQGISGTRAQNQIIMNEAKIG